MKNDFIKILENIDRSKSRQENFRNFCEMAYCAIAKKTQINEKKANVLEERYMEIVGTYSDKDDVRKMPELLTWATLAISEGGCDFLGEIAGEIEALDKQSGQFFTPYHVSKMMAQIQMPDIGGWIKKNGFFSLSDPAAGAGCMILAVADMVEELGYDLMEAMSVQAIELNRTTYHMLFIQLALRGVAAEVIHGNSLTLETYETAHTPAAIYFYGKHGRLFDKREEGPKKEPVIITPIENTQQLSLFDNGDLQIS